MPLLFYFKSESIDRMTWWAAGLRMFRSHPMVGVGLGAFATAFPYFKTSGTLNTLYAHNFPIQILAETGLIGCLGLFCFGISYYRAVHNILQESEEQRAYRSALVSLLCFSLATIYLEYFIGKLMLGIIMALSLSMADHKSAHLSKALYCGPIFLFLLLIPGWYFPFVASQAYVAGERFAVSGRTDLAQKSWQEAIRLNPLEDESFASLADLHWQIYQINHSVTELSDWQTLLRKAWRLKKDIRYTAALSHTPEVRKTLP
jgi:hypothetical protein